MMIEKYKWAVAERLGRKIGLDDYTYELASDAVDTLIELGWCPPRGIDAAVLKWSGR